METGTPARLSVSDGRGFAFPVALAFAALCGLFVWRGYEAAAWTAAGLAAALATAGLLAPSRLGPVYRGWMALGLALSKVTTPVFMSVVYFGVLTPIGILRRTLGSNPIVHEARNDSFWVVRSKGATRSDLDRQF